MGDGVSASQAKARLATHDKFSRQKTRRQVEKDLYGFNEDGTDRDETIMSMAHNSHRIKLSKEETHAKVKLKRAANVFKAVAAFKGAGKKAEQRRSKAPDTAKTRAMKGLLNLARSGGVAGNAEAAPAPAGGKLAKAKVNEVDLDEAVV